MRRRKWPESQRNCSHLHGGHWRIIFLQKTVAGTQPKKSQNSKYLRIQYRDNSRIKDYQELSHSNFKMLRASNYILSSCKSDRSTSWACHTPRVSTCTSAFHDQHQSCREPASNGWELPVCQYWMHRQLSWVGIEFVKAPIESNLGTDVPKVFYFIKSKF